MTNKPGEANFFPDVPTYPEIGTFQPIYGKFDLTTYIQGASDYEIMAFLVGKYNATLEAYGTVTKLSTETIEAAHQLQDWINNWFNNLDVQQELNNKIDQMVADGSFGTLLHQTFDAQINQQTTNAVTAWLVANVTPTGSAVVVDKSLSIKGAAADSKEVGDIFNQNGLYPLTLNYSKTYTPSTSSEANVTLNTNIPKNAIYSILVNSDEPYCFVSVNYDYSQNAITLGRYDTNKVHYLVADNRTTSIMIYFSGFTKLTTQTIIVRSTTLSNEYASHNNYITPESYGAKGDGTTDDTIALQNAIYAAEKTGFLLLQGKTYLTKTLYSTIGFTLIGYNSGTKYTQSMPNKTSTLKSVNDSDILVLSGTKYNISNVDFCGTVTTAYSKPSGTPSNSALLRFLPTGSSWSNQENDTYITNCRFRNSNGYGISTSRVFLSINECIFDYNMMNAIITDSTASELYINNSDFYYNGYLGGGKGCDIRFEAYVCRITNCNLYNSEECIQVAAYARDVLIQNCALGSAQRNILEIFGSLVIVQNTRFVGADKTTSGTHYYGDIFIAKGGSNDIYPVIIENCQFDSADSNYNINITDTNIKDIYLINPIYISNADAITNKPELIKIPSYKYMQ